MMQVTLNADLRKFVSDRVEAGQYESASAVVSDALTVFRAQQTLTPEDIAELRELVDVAIVQLDRGETARFNAKDIGRLGRKVLASRDRASSKKAPSKRARR